MATLAKVYRRALDHLPRKHGDDCLQELRWIDDRRDLAEARPTMLPGSANGAGRGSHRADGHFLLAAAQHHNPWQVSTSSRPNARYRNSASSCRPSQVKNLVRWENSTNLHRVCV